MTEIAKESIDEDKITCFQSAHVNNRIVAQEGAFLSFPLPKKFNKFHPLDDNTNEMDSDVLIRDQIVIPKKEKKNIRKQLRKLGITHRSLFPDLDGVAKAIYRGFEE